MTLRFEQRGDIAVLTLDRPPANALDATLVADLRGALHRSAGAHAVVMASALPSIFSAGWDLPTVLGLDRPQMDQFVGSFCDLIGEIFAFQAPVIAALSGHAIAGGLIVAAAADERFLAEGSAQLGLSEVLLGVPVPRCCLEIFLHAIGPRATERLAATGENLSGESATHIGLVDRIVSGPLLLESALERARFLAARPPNAYLAIKRESRAAALERFQKAKHGDPFLDFWFSADARERIGQLVAKLKKT